MDKERFFTVIAGIGGIIALLGAYLIGFYHGVRVEKEKVIQDILSYQKQIANYKRKIIEKEQKIKELEAKTKKIVNLTQKVAQAIDSLSIPKKNEKENTQVDQIFILQSKEDEKKVKRNFLLEPDTFSENSQNSLQENNPPSTVASKKEVSLQETSSRGESQSHEKNIEEKNIQTIFWTIQLGAFLKYEQAKVFLQNISKKIDLNPFLFIRKEGNYYKVCLGKFSSKERALKVLKLLKTKKINGRFYCF